MTAYLHTTSPHYRRRSPSYSLFLCLVAIVLPSILCFVAYRVAFTAGFYAGWQYHADSVQSANGLLQAGFTIIDPSGHTIRVFDESPAPEERDLLLARPFKPLPNAGCSFYREPVANGNSPPLVAKTTAKRRNRGF